MCWLTLLPGPRPDQTCISPYLGSPAFPSPYSIPPPYYSHAAHGLHPLVQAYTTVV